MKITIVCGFLLPVPPVAGGAMEKMWWRLARLYARRGHQVTLLSRRWPGWADDETGHPWKFKGPEQEIEVSITGSLNVNNLDLNEDGETDYIRVVDNMDGDAHALVLQAVLSETESQDVAVIEIEKQGAEAAILQIVGDADIYGEQTIAEPFAEEASEGGWEFDVML